MGIAEVMGVCSKLASPKTRGDQKTFGQKSFRSFSCRSEKITSLRLSFPLFAQNLEDILI